eukprot:gene3139-biopygen12701
MPAPRPRQCPVPPGIPGAPGSRSGGVPPLTSEMHNAGGKLSRRISSGSGHRAALRRAVGVGAGQRVVEPAAGFPPLRRAAGRARARASLLRRTQHAAQVGRHCGPVFVRVST